MSTWQDIAILHRARGRRLGPEEGALRHGYALRLRGARGHHIPQPFRLEGIKLYFDRLSRVKCWDDCSDRHIITVTAARNGLGEEAGAAPRRLHDCFGRKLTKIYNKLEQKKKETNVKS